MGSCHSLGRTSWHKTFNVFPGQVDIRRFLWNLSYMHPSKISWLARQNWKQTPSFSSCSSFCPETDNVVFDSQHQHDAILNWLGFRHHQIQVPEFCWMEPGSGTATKALEMLLSHAVTSSRASSGATLFLAQTFLYIPTILYL